MVDLPRLRPFPKNSVRPSPQQRLAEAAVAIHNLALDMPTRVETGNLFKQSLVPPRVVSLREVQRYRMLEISKAACECLQHDQAIAGAILTRAAFETAAVLFYADNAIRKAVDEDTLGQVGETLLRLIVGSKNQPGKPEAVNAITMIRHLDRQYPKLMEEYDHLCEVAHPNLMGALVPFGEHTPDLDLTLAPKPSFGNQFAAPLVIALTVFECHYNRIADVFPAFCDLCRRQAPKPLKGSAP